MIIVGCSGWHIAMRYIMSRRLRPKKLLSQLVEGKTMALEIK
jgi:hypothetical protein